MRFNRRAVRDRLTTIMQGEDWEELERLHPRFSTALAAGATAGLAVDLLFYPIDTIKTRLQSAQGFWKSGGFAGVYRGMGSVAVGSAPGGMFSCIYLRSICVFCDLRDAESAALCALIPRKLL